MPLIAWGGNIFEERGDGGLGMRLFMFADRVNTSSSSPRRRHQTRLQIFHISVYRHFFLFVGSLPGRIIVDMGRGEAVFLSKER